MGKKQNTINANIAHLGRRQMVLIAPKKKKKNLREAQIQIQPHRKTKERKVKGKKKITPEIKRKLTGFL